MHMMEGMACVVRAIQEVTLTPELEDALGFDPPLATNDTCPDVPVRPCMHGGAGSWERLPDSPIFIVHAAMLRTGKVLLWSGAAEVGYPLNSLVWDPANPADMTICKLTVRTSSAAGTRGCRTGDCASPAATSRGPLVIRARRSSSIRRQPHPGRRWRI